MELASSFSCSDSSSSSESSFSPPSSRAAENHMVSIEMEAAEALADLAHLAMRESGSGDSGGGGKWGSKRKRGKTRVKSESPPVDSFSKPVHESAPSCPDLSRDPAIVNQLQQCGGLLCNNVIIKSAKIEQVSDICKPSKLNAAPLKAHTSQGGGRSRQNLTEEEKEERRLRRILANRESARQTIRRRQALCEELTKKAADLTWENESLKKEKESVVKEFQSLESRNKHLKAMMAKLMKTEAVESSTGIKPVHDEKLNNPTTNCQNNPTTNCQLFMYNQHQLPALCWPSIIPSSNAVQSHHGPQTAIVIPSNISMPPNGKIDLSQQQHQNPLIVNGSGTPLYIVPCPWFFPVPDHGNAFQRQPPLGLKYTLDGTSVNDQCTSTSSSKAALLMENQLPLIYGRVKSEASSSAEVRIINDLNETPVELPSDGDGQCAVLFPKETGLAPVTVEEIAVPPLTIKETILAPVPLPLVAIKNESMLRSEFSSNSAGICTNSRQLQSSLSAKNRDPFKYRSKKIVDATAAAEARRRRKELTKLKNLHSRQCQMNC